MNFNYHYAEYLFENLSNEDMFSSLKHLNLSKCLLTDQFGTILVILIRDSKFLLELNISSN